MQEQKEAKRIREKLFTGVDNDYNVTNQAIVNEVLDELENFPISWKSLEASRLGKHINEIRRRSTDRVFAARAKALVKKWRTLLAAEQKEQQQKEQQQREQQQQQHAQLQSTNHHHQQQAAQQQQHGLASNGRASSSGLPAGSGNIPEADASYSASSRVLKSNNHIPSVPNGKLPSTATSSSCQPNMGAAPAGAGSRHRNNGHSGISSLPSSASTSPGLSRPTTPRRLVSPAATVSPVTPAESKTNAANKRLRKDALEADDPAEDNEDANQGPSKRPRLNNPNVSNGQQDFLHDFDTRDSFNSQTSSAGGDRAGPSFFGVTKLPNASGASNSCDNFLDQSAAVSQDGINGNDSNAGNGRSTPHTTKHSRSSRRCTRAGATPAPEEGIGSLEQQVQSVRKSSGRKRTTQEIIKDLAQLSNSPTINIASASTAPQAQQESKTELMNRFFESQAPGSADDSTSPPLSQVPSPDATSVTTNQSDSREPSRSQSRGRSSGTTTPANPPPPPILQQSDPVGDIMDQLPWVYQSQVEEELEDEGDIEGLIPAHPPKPPQIVTEELVEQLHVDSVENFNGNFDHCGGFKEWHEVVTKETVRGDILYVLPYSIIE